MSKKQYRVTIREVHHQDVLVTASSADEARELVANGEGDPDESTFCYSHSLDSDTWRVEEE